MAAPILHHKSLPLRRFGGSPAPFYFNFFSAKDICTINFNFFTFIYIWNHVRSVSFSDGGSRDRDIIFRDRRYLVFRFLGCVVKFQARDANNSWRRSTSSNPCKWVCVLFLFHSFLFFFFSFLILAFFHDQTHTGTDTTKGGAERRGKVERRHWRAVRFTRFVDYRLMFDSGRSFSLQYDLIRSPY